MAKKCARTFSIVVEKGKKSILDVTHLLPVGIARYVRPMQPEVLLASPEKPKSRLQCKIHIILSEN
jgi:hypothetical protein